MEDTVSDMDETKQRRKGRRSFTDEFRAGAVRLVLDEGKSLMQVARDLDLHPNSLREWVSRAKADRSKGKTGLRTDVHRGLALRWHRRKAEGLRNRSAAARRERSRIEEQGVELMTALRQDFSRQEIPYPVDQAHLLETLDRMRVSITTADSSWRGEHPEVALVA
jgi:transposase-like protein